MKWTKTIAAFLAIASKGTAVAETPSEATDATTEDLALPVLRGGADPSTAIADFDDRADDVRSLFSSAMCTGACTPPAGAVCVQPAVSQFISASDGTYDDWLVGGNLTHLEHLRMWNQGDPFNNKGGAKPVKAKAYMNYNCGVNQKLCVLVLAEDGITLEVDTAEAWIKLYEYSSSPATTTDVQFLYDTSGAAIGWEGCFDPILEAPPPTCYGDPGVQIHVNDVNGKTLSTGKGGRNSGPLFYLELPDCDVICATTDCGGDPHFQTWTGQRFNFHGECDLVLAQSDSFQGGKGLAVHVRTKIKQIYSLITAVAVSKGGHVFEFNHLDPTQPEYYVDNVLVTELPFANEEFQITTETLHNEDYDEAIQVITIDLGNKSVVKLTVMQEWVFVHMRVPEKEAAACSGLSGSFPDGRMLGRDGVTELGHDRNLYGAEWQVQGDHEPQLFQFVPDGHPQAPHDACKLPSVDAHQYLRTEHGDMYNQAVEACQKEGVSGGDLEDCVFDVAVLKMPKIAAAWWGKEKSDA